MKTYDHHSQKIGRTHNKTSASEQQSPLHVILQTYTSSGGCLPLQLVKNEYKVSGITHIVQMNEEGSLMDGKVICTVSHGDKVLINDSICIRSRRGPNREVYETVDRKGLCLYKWYSVERLHETPLPPNCFIREDTLDTQAIKIKDREEKRTRILPEQMSEHVCAARIIQSAKGLTLSGLDESTLSEKELVSLFTIKLAYGLSTDAGIQQALNDDQSDLIMKVVRILERVCSKQILQDWGDDKGNDLKNRAYGWGLLANVMDDASATAEQKRNKLCDCLDHDKGYAQMVSYLQRALLPLEEVELSFEEIVKEALKEERNMNIFGGSMVNATISQQITKEDKLYETKTTLSQEREKAMWISITTAIVNVKSQGRSQKDWTYYKVMEEHIDSLFEIVQSQTNHLKFNKEVLAVFLSNPF